MIKNNKVGSNYISFMIIPSSNRGTFAFRLPLWSILVIGSLFISLFLFSGLALYFGFQTTFQLNDYQNLKTVSEITEKKLENMNSQIDNLKSDLVNLIDKEEEIRNLLGESNKAQYIQSRNNLKKKTVEDFQGI